VEVAKHTGLYNTNKMANTLALALLSSTCSALMFHSKNVSKQWDTWVFVENKTFYAYYLVTEVSYGEGFGVGTSTDGVHWTDHGYVWHGPSWWNPGTKDSPKQFWEGSSAVWRAKDFNETGRYLINYSQMNTICNCQNITFAESYDLIHWSNGLEKNESDAFPWFNIDSNLYKVKGGRWDTIYSIPVPGPGQENLRDGYPRYGYWTASPLDGNGTFGFGITDDGFNWKALPSPQMLPEPIGAELVSAVCHTAACSAISHGACSLPLPMVHVTHRPFISQPASNHIRAWFNHPPSSDPRRNDPLQHF
jgi:hypothetical protein